MRHLENEQLERYAKRQLKAAEMMQIVLHLDECEVCFEAFQEMFPNFSDAARKVSTEIFTTDEAEHFHLDYDEHLKPFVDSEADAATREIVENHLQVCSLCAQSVRELREFSSSLQIRETQKESSESFVSGIAAKQFLPGFFSANRNLIGLSLAGILILTLGGWLIWRQTEQSNLIALNQSSESNQEISKKNSSEQLPKKIITDQPSNLLSLNQNDSKNKKKITNSNQGDERQLPEEEKLLANLPANLRTQVQDVIRTQKLNLPVFINQLREIKKLRGETETMRRIILTPNGQAVRDVSPILKWQKFSNDDERYSVTIYDKDFNQIAVSPVLKDVKWRIDSSLKRGEIYKWQVKSENSPESYTGQFKVLDVKALEKLRKAENTNSPLVRGIVYASEGLLNEANLEFQKEINRNPQGNLARKLQTSIIERQK